MTCMACEACTAFRFRAAGYAIHACSHCGLGAAEVADFVPQSYYTRDYFQGGHSDGYGDYEGSAEVLRAEFRDILRLLEHHDVREGRLLEIGCAFGFFLDVASERFKVRGIEIADAAAASARARGHDVVTGVATADNTGRELDAVVMLDVIEHLQDPDAVMGLVARALKPGGKLVVTTGDFGSAFSRLMGPKWRLMTPPQHLFFFTVPSLKALLSRHGLEVESVEHPWKKVPLSLIGYQMQRMTGLPLGKLLSSRMGVPVNLFDACRLVARRR